MSCPFCSTPCGNDHCPYMEEEVKLKEQKNCDIIKRGLEEENRRLKETVRTLQEWISKNGCEN